MGNRANPAQDFQFFLNRYHIVGGIHTRYEQLWAERELFYRVLETLPQVLRDTSDPANLFRSNQNIRPTL